MALFGFIAEAIFGYNVLLSYAIWGVPLLLVWNWRKRALLAALLFCAASQSLYNVGAGAYQWATLGVEGTRAANKEIAASDRAARQARAKGSSSESFRAVVEARLTFMPWFYTRSFSFTPSFSFTYFLVGLLALRLGVFQQPGEHRRLILGVMAFGILSWIAAHWILPLPWPVLEIQRVSGPIRSGLRIIREEWLALTYIGAVLLATVSWPQLISRLDVFALAGRMALSNYMIHIALIDVIGRPYGFGVGIHSAFAPLAAFALFPALVLFSRCWLQKYQYGPAEWVLRSITYWKPQPMRLDAGAVEVEHSA